MHGNDGTAQLEGGGKLDPLWEHGPIFHSLGPNLSEVKPNLSEVRPQSLRDRAKSLRDFKFAILHYVFTLSDPGRNL